MRRELARREVLLRREVCLEAGGLAGGGRRSVGARRDCLLVNEQDYGTSKADMTVPHEKFVSQNTLGAIFSRPNALGRRLHPCVRRRLRGAGTFVEEPSGVALGLRDTFNLDRHRVDRLLQPVEAHVWGP